jgi:hypothetical protein
MLDVKILLIKRAEVAVHDVRDFRFVDEFGDPVLIHG